ncbi:MAG: sulfate adenylyltransferase [Betaproteobacteria bacterium]|nr:sulfate adenylyltransferase [Betaproteobacteria bacterium]
MAAVSAPGLAPARRGALRFITAGSVDDGKSTLIGRLLYDSRAILADQLESLRPRTSGDAGNDLPDLSLLTDGLEAEREQGITIDVAFRYFATRQRKFVIADAPGHEQYTRNMVTAAAGSDAAVVLVDLTKIDLGRPDGPPVELLRQTRRHALLAHLLRVPHIVFAVNKIDAVAEPARAFAAVRAALLRFAAEAGIVPAGILPVSALRGDNVARPFVADASSGGSWYRGPTLLELLEQLPEGDAATSAEAPAPLLLPVQYVARGAGEAREAAGPGEQPRTYWGRIAQGAAAVGDEVQVHPSGQRARIVALRHAGRAAERLAAGTSAGVVLDRQLDISRGDWLGAPGQLAPVDRFEATIAWLDTEPAVPGRRYWVRHAHRWVAARIERIEHRLDIRTLAPEAANELTVNQIGRAVVRLQQPLPLVPYAASRTGGALIVVDPASHRTSGALLVAAIGGDEPRPQRAAQTRSVDLKR